MPDSSLLLTQSSAAELARLHELLDALQAGRAAEPAAGLPDALSRLQASASDARAEIGVTTEPSDALLGPRAEATAVGFAGFGAASALLLNEQYGPPLPGASPDAALASPLLRADAALAADEVPPPTVGAERPLATEADWAAAGAQDRALLDALRDAGVPPDALPLALGLSATPPAQGDALAVLDHAIARIDAQLAAVAADAAFLDVPVPAAEVAVAVEALASQPLDTLVAQARVAATAYQQQVEATAGVAGDDVVDLLPDLAAPVDLVEALEAALPDVVDAVADLLDQVVTRTAEGELVPVGELVAGIGDALDDLLDGLDANLDDVLAPVQAVIDPLVDVAGNVVGGAVDGVGDVLTGVGTTVGGVTDTLDGLLDAIGAGLGQALAPVPGALDAVGGTLAGLGDLVESVLNPAAPEPAVPLVDAVAQLGETLPLEPLADGLQDVLALVAPAEGPGLEGDGPGFAGTLPSLGTELVDASDALGQALNGLLKPGG